MAGHSTLRLSETLKAAVRSCPRIVWIISSGYTNSVHCLHGTLTRCAVLAGRRLWLLVRGQQVAPAGVM